MVASAAKHSVCHRKMGFGMALGRRALKQEQSVQKSWLFGAANLSSMWPSVFVVGACECARRDPI